MLSRFTGPFYINLSLQRIINLEKNVNLFTHTWINSNTVPKINTMKSGMNFIQYMCQETRLYYSPHLALAPSFTLKNTFEGSLQRTTCKSVGIRNFRISWLRKLSEMWPLIKNAFWYFVDWTLFSVMKPGWERNWGFKSEKRYYTVIR